MIAQQVLPSQVPYTVLDYGVTVMVLVVLGITLWFVFRTQRQILSDHAEAMGHLAESMRVMKEELMTLVVDTRHLHASVTDMQRDIEWERAMGIGRREGETQRHQRDTPE